MIRVNHLAELLFAADKAGLSAHPICPHFSVWTVGRDGHESCIGHIEYHPGREQPWEVTPLLDDNPGQQTTTHSTPTEAIRRLS